MQISQNLQNPYLSYSNQFNTLQQDSTKIQSEQEKDKQKESSVGEKTTPSGEPLSEGEQQYIRELESIDRNVKAHEAAHIAAGGGVVSGGASYGYTRGPDGKMYVTSGEVPISMKKGRTPEETIQNARQIQAAALAPSDPSPQDYKVSASAAQMEASARSEQAQEKAKEAEENLEQTRENNKNSNEQGNTEKTQTQEQNGFFENDKTNANNSTESDTKTSKNTDLYSYAINSYTQNSKTYTPRFEIAG